MLEDTTRFAAGSASAASAYGPFHLELDPAISSRILARARRDRDERLAAMRQDLRFRITHWLYGLSLDAGRFLHHHSVLRGIPR